MSKVKNQPYPLILPKKFQYIYGYEMDFNRSIEEIGYISSNLSLPRKFSSMGEKRRAEYIAGRICAKKSIERLDIISSFVGINCDRSPCWPENIVGSITHNNSRAIAIVASIDTYSNLGVDIESIITKDIRKLISQDIIDDKEHLVIKSPVLKHLSEEAFVTLVFSAKESIFKALYCDVGCFFGFEVVKLIRASKSNLTFELRSRLCKKWGSGMRVDVYFGVSDKVVFTMVAISSDTL